MPPLLPPALEPAPEPGADEPLLHPAPEEAGLAHAHLRVGLRVELAHHVGRLTVARLEEAGSVSAKSPLTLPTLDLSGDVAGHHLRLPLRERARLGQRQAIAQWNLRNVTDSID